MENTVRAFTFDVNEEGLIGGKSLRFQPDLNKPVRLSIASWPLAEDGLPVMESPVFRGGKRIYSQELRSYVLSKGAEYEKLLGERARPCIAVSVVVWPESADTWSERVSGASARVWLFSEGKYRQLRKRNSEWPLSQHDVQVELTDKNWQRMDFEVKKDNHLVGLLKLARESDDGRKVWDRLWAKVREAEEALPREIGRAFDSIEELKKELGVGDDVDTDVDVALDALGDLTAA